MKSDSPDFWLALGLVSALLPHALYFPVWISALAALLISSRFFFPQLLSPWLPKFLSLAAAAGIYLQYGTLFARDSGLALFALLITLKLFELKTRRDRSITAFLGYFFSITLFFDTQTMLAALGTLFSVLLFTMSLLALYCKGANARTLLRQAGMLLLQSAPLALVLFALFPRIHGPLWGLPEEKHAAKTGLSDTLSPGSISNLGLSDEVAFRAAFPDKLPPPSALYWRGPVMDEFDGRNWRMGRLRFTSHSFQGMGVPYRYNITLEPSGKNWLFALDLPASLPPRSMLSADFQVLSFSPVNERMRYDISSFIDYRYGLDEDPEKLAEMSTVPKNFNPKAQALARKWAKEGGHPEAVVEAAMNYFKNGGFSYTLQPPLLGRDAVDDFLFGARSGFCEHYAASFAFLMRAAGIPARIVTGYQGGEYNPLGRYYLVRQADAHAWTEVWLKNRGWVRIDPTALVAPSRVGEGISAALPAAEPFMQNPIARNLGLGLDAIVNGWNQWVVGYGEERQRMLLDRFGVKKPEVMVIVLSVASLIALGLLAARLLMNRQPADPLQKAYFLFCGKMAKLGLVRLPFEGPLDFLERIEKRKPELSARAREFLGLYIKMRYGKLGVDAKHLARLAKEFRA